MVQFNIKGAVAPVFTPTKEDYSVNYDVIPNYLRYLADEGIQTILVGGTTGEAMCLGVEERMKLSESWMQSAKPHRMRVIIQVGGAPLPDVLKLAKHAEEIKADAILTLPELYHKPKSVEQLVSYLELVSAVAPSLPLLYYHFPMMSGVSVDVKQLFTLASSRITNFKGMKADLGVAVEVANILKDDQAIFIANHLLAPAALLGFDSSIATITNVFPKLIVQILESLKYSDVLKARDLQDKLNSDVDNIASEGDWIPTMKHAMELITGIQLGPPRLPLVPLTETQKYNMLIKLRSSNLI